MQAEKVLTSKGPALLATRPLAPLLRGDDYASTSSQKLRPGCRDRLTATALLEQSQHQASCAGAHRADAFIGFRLGARGIGRRRRPHISAGSFFCGKGRGHGNRYGEVVQRRQGYGFITPDDGGEDLFAHFSAIQMNGFKTLKEGQKVQFEVVQGPKGKQASNITAPA